MLFRSIVFAIVFISLVGLLVILGIVYLTCDERRVQQEEAIVNRRMLQKVTEANEDPVLRSQKSKLKEECNYKGGGDKSMLSAKQRMERSLHNMRVDTTLGFEDDLNHDVAAEI